jgi:hypothetical protein
MTAERGVMNFGRNSIHDALYQLARAERELAKFVDWKVLCGFNFAEIAALRNLPERTVQRSWEKAQLSPSSHSSGFPVLRN